MTPVFSLHVRLDGKDGKCSSEQLYGLDKLAEEACQKIGKVRDELKD